MNRKYYWQPLPATEHKKPNKNDDFRISSDHLTQFRDSQDIASMFVLFHFILFYFVLFHFILSYLIAILCSILDSQLSWEPGKFQLARWSHRVVIFPAITTHPPTCPPTHLLGNFGRLYLSIYKSYIFSPHFKFRYVGQSGTGNNCQRDICPCIICPGDICPCQEYLSS